MNDIETGLYPHNSSSRISRIAKQNSIKFCSITVWINISICPKIIGIMEKVVFQVIYDIGTQL